MAQKSFVNDREGPSLSTMLCGRINGIYKQAEAPPRGIKTLGTRDTRKWYYIGDSGRWHGTYCAGVAATLKNSECVIGSAYDAKIAGLRFLDSNTGATQADEATAFIYKLSDIDIYSNTWGSPDIGIFVDQLPDVVKAAFEEGVQSGRGGKAVSKSGTLTSYSEHCSAVMAAAYSGDSETNADDLDISTTGPSNTCVNNFDGTSATCPLAAEIIALTLQANNALTWEIFSI
ncbi:hypothetical protein DPMN_100053 [Dreissena polymorpha]|uniref:Peptidase S8/S53 domain-containing protein n=1 Tax=Dreissena polymorpha TaxID=45954 RepID=A0A9D4R704_DREPO|nr:hypothetical protein DPMN_100053 [Dreissena polymorpha]